MAAVKTSLALNDQMSAVLKRINRAMSSTLDAFEAVQEASGRTFDTTNISNARQEIGRANAAIAEMDKHLRDADNQQNKLNQDINHGTSSADGLMNKIKGLAAAYLGMQTAKGVVGLSDEVVQTRARLEMMNDGLQTTDDLMNMIFQSAESARGNYLDMAAAVAKLGNNAGDAFGSTAEIVKFSELVQKQFTIAGASGTEASNAMIQLTQALGSGVLRGDELNSIFEQAPNLIRTIADYMGVGVGQIRAMASEGKITADIVKSAMFASADEIDAKFNQMPMTWGQVWVSLKNQAIGALDPLLTKISQLANDPSVQSAISGTLNALKRVVTALSWILSAAFAVYSFFANNWGAIAPIVYGIVAAFAAYNAALLVHKGVLAVSAVAAKLKEMADYRQAKATLAAAKAAGINTADLASEASMAAADASATDLEAVAKAKATVAQTSFNTSLLASPLTWFIGTLVVVTAALYALGASLEVIIGVIAALVVAYGIWQVAQYALNSAMYACPIVWILAIVIGLIVILFILFKTFTKEIVGAIYWLGSLFKNIGMWIANLAIAIWNSIKNIGKWFANLGLAAWQVICNVGAWFANLGSAAWAIIKNTGLWFANVGMGIWKSVGAVVENIGIAFNNGWLDIQIGFWGMVNIIMQGLKAIAELANTVLGWMGVNIDTSGLDFAAKKIDELNAKREDYKSISDAWDEGMNTFAYDDVGAAWNSHEYGDVGEAFNTYEIDWAGDWESGMTTLGYDDLGAAYDAGAEAGAGIQSWMDDNLSLNGIMGALGLEDLIGGGDNGAEGKIPGTGDPLDPAGYGDELGDIAGDTGSIAASTNKSAEEMEYLRDIAEKEAINRFTTAEIKVDMTGMTNRIDSDMDIDGVISHLTNELEVALVTAAEGVY